MKKKKVEPLEPLRPVYAWMTLKQAAEFCGLSYSFLRKAASSCQLAVYVTGYGSTAKIVVDPVDLDAWRRKHLIYRPAID